MKFTILRDALETSLSAAIAATPGRTVLPILGNVLVEAEGDGVRLSATDLDTTLRLRVPAEVEQPGSTTLPAKLLRDIAAKLPTGPIAIEAEGNSASIRAGRSRFGVPTLNADEFPVLPAMENPVGWTLTGAELALCASVAFAASTTTTRPILNGVHWHTADEGRALVAVATNTRIMARVVVPLAAPIPADTAPAGELIMTRHALHLVRKLLGGEACVEVERSGNHIALRAKGIEIYSRLFEGTYPTYEQVIPKDNPLELRADRRVLLDAISRAALAADEDSHRLVLEIEGTDLTIRADTDGRSAREVLSVGWTGEPLRIGFNAQYLTAILGRVQTDEIRITFAGPGRAALLLPVGDVPGDPLYLAMPLRLLD